MITFFKDKNHESKKKNEKYKTITTILKSFDTFVIFSTRSGSFALSLTGIGLMVYNNINCNSMWIINWQ